MRVVISTCGRFHLFPLAKELEQAGHLTRIYSGFTWSALKREGVERRFVKTFPVVRPVLMALRFLPFDTPATVRDLMHQASVVLQDHFVARDLPDCDIFVGHEAVGLISGQAAQKRGARYVCDRGCSHIGWQKNILDEEYDKLGIKKEKVTPRTLEREIEEYHKSDLIVVPSTFVANTFVSSGIPREKLRVVPYGVNVQTFNKIYSPENDVFEVIFVGSLSVRKGAPYLLDGFSRIPMKNKRLTLIGEIDAEIRQTCSDKLAADNIRILGHVPHVKLREHMSKSHVLVLPSVEDGMGMVVPEALACGCPVIVSENAGACEFITDGREGFVVPIRNPDAIAEKCLFLASNLDLRNEMSTLAVDRTRSIGGWSHYGQSMIETYASLL